MSRGHASGRSWGRRTTAGLALAAAAPWLAGCGAAGTAEEPPPEVVIPGSTVTIGAETSPSTGTPTAPGTTSEPSEPSEPSESGAPEATGSVASASELLTKVGGAMGAYGTVRVSSSANGITQEADYAYLAGDDYVVRIDLDTSPVQEYRKVGDTLYYLPGGSEDWQVFVSGEAPEELEALLTEAAAYRLLGDLTREFKNAEDFAYDADAPAEVDGTTVESYTFTLQPEDLAADPASAEMAPEGDVQVTFAIDADGLPVQATYVFANGSSYVATYSGWGDDVDIEVPDLA